MGIKERGNFDTYSSFRLMIFSIDGLMVPLN
jgi:hypothetical protein